MAESKRQRFPDPEDVTFDYKNPQLLKHYLSDRGKVVPARVSGLTAQQQRKLTQAIKRARQLALLPYTVK